MCAPSAPSMPELPPTPPPAPVNQPLIKDPEMPTPPPVTVDSGAKDGPKVKKRKSKRESLQQSSTGASALRIPLNTGASKGKTGSLNIPK